MLPAKPSRLLLLLGLTAPLFAQIPAQPPTQAPAEAAPPTPAQMPPKDAKISLDSGQLDVMANNSSLNQILRRITQLAGITLTGSVPEERVFGNYGPGKPSEVIGQLLDGTSTNILFIASTGDKPSELILTPRAGAPTPPSSNSASRSEDNDDANALAVNPPPPADPDAAAQASPPAQPAPAPAQAPAVSGQQSPNNVKTPQQIYDQLMKMRQQQSQ